MKVAIVTWHDAHASQDFQDSAEVTERHAPRLVRSVGFVYKRDRVGITIVRCTDDQDDFDGRLFIPAGMIKTVRILRA